MPTLTGEQIEEMVRRLVAALSPLRIYLFGSHAYGVPGPHSDIDLYIIVDEEFPEIGECAKRGYGCFVDTGAPVELHFSGPKTFERRAAAGVGLESEVRARGRLLYAA